MSNMGGDSVFMIVDTPLECSCYFTCIMNTTNSARYKTDEIGGVQVTWLLVSWIYSYVRDSCLLKLIDSHRNGNV